MAEYNEEAQRAKVAAGFKGGPWYQKPILHPAMSFVDGVPAEVKAKMDFAKNIGGTTSNPFGSRSR